MNAQVFRVMRTLEENFDALGAVIVSAADSIPAAQSSAREAVLSEWARASGAFMRLVHWLEHSLTDSRREPAANLHEIMGDPAGDAAGESAHPDLPLPPRAVACFGSALTVLTALATALARATNLAATPAGVPFAPSVALDALQDAVEALATPLEQ